MHKPKYTKRNKMSAKQFINWYALKIDSDFDTAKNSLTYVKTTSPKIYKFLVDEFLGFREELKNDRDTSVTFMESEANIPKKIFTRMAFQSSAPNKIGVEYEAGCTYLTDMASDKNISKYH